VPDPGFTYYRPLVDANGTSLSNFPCKVLLNSGNFNFALPKSDGSDFRVYDATASAEVPYWLETWDLIGQQATIWFLATNTGHSHQLCYGNSGASSASNFQSVFGSTYGTDFATDWGHLTTSTSGSTAAATRLADPTSTSDIRNFQVWRLGESPILSITDLTNAGVDNTHYTGVREFSPVRDGANKIVQVNGKYYVFFARRPSGLPYHLDTWRGECASSPYGPFTNFVQIYNPPSPVRLGSVGCVIQIGSLYYLYMDYGWSESGTTSPGLSIYYMTSSDCITWSGVTQCLTPGVFNDQTSGACTDIGNPWVIKCDDGVYMMVVEGYNISNGAWACFGATSSDGIAWTVLNSGNNLVPKGGTGTWDQSGAANPKCFQLPDNTYLINYNGADNSGTSDWQDGYATASTRGGTYTKNSLNPMVGRTQGSYGIETSALCYDTDGASILGVVQRFVTTSNTGSFYRIRQEKFRGGLLLSRDTPGTQTTSDAAIAGQLISASSFILETKSIITAHRTDNATPILLGLWNSATLPTLGTAASLASIRVIEIFRNSWDRNAPGDLTVLYYDNTGTRQFWNGTSWSATSTSVSGVAQYDDEVVCQIIFDGTNYSFKAFTSAGANIFATTAVAASAIRSMAAGKYMIMGDPFTDSWEAGIFLRYASLRPYTATEPSFSMTQQTPTGTPAMPLFFGRSV